MNDNQKNVSNKKKKIIKKENINKNKNNQNQNTNNQNTNKNILNSKTENDNKQNKYKYKNNNKNKNKNKYKYDQNNKQKNIFSVVFKNRDSEEYKKKKEETKEIEKNILKMNLEKKKYLKKQNKQTNIESELDEDKKDFKDLLNIFKEKNKNVTAEEIKKIKKAYGYAKYKHKGQMRNSGEEYITHPVRVAYLLANLGLDSDTISAGLLHDILEDTNTSREELVDKFGESIYEMVEGVTKLGMLSYQGKEETQVENYRKMFLAMGKDIRVVLIKLADRLHNMRTLKYKRRERQLAIAKETLDVYAPLANRLGIRAFKGELEDLSFKYLMPEEYKKIIQGLDRKKEERTEYLNHIIKELEESTKEAGIKCSIHGRIKHIYSIYKKMQRENAKLEEIYDIFAVRVLVDDVPECYKVLGILHDKYTPILNRFKDYIAVPKQNMYQSIHTTIIARTKQKYNNPFEVQIRTYGMHEVAENGIAAHWAYKEANYKGKKTTVKVTEDKFSWIRKSLEWQENTKDPDQFMEALKTELFEDEVYVFTPKGDIKVLPRGSNTIDLAYMIHEAIGNKMTGAKINTRIVPILTELKNGDIVEIITSENSKGPSRDWANQVKTPGARNKISRWFKKETREENVERGKEILEKEIKKTGVKPFEYMKVEWLDTIAQRYGFPKIEDLYAAIGFGNMSPNRIVKKLEVYYNKENEDKILENKLKEIEKHEETSQGKYKNSGILNNGIYVKGLDNVLIRLAKCCKPVPGDEILGYVTQGRGVTVHRVDCLNADKLLENEFRTIEVLWGKNQTENYIVEIEIFAINRNELLKDIIAKLERNKVEIEALNSKVIDEHKAEIDLKIIVKDNMQLEKVISSLSQIDSVYDIKRKRG